MISPVIRLLLQCVAATVLLGACASSQLQVPLGVTPDQAFARYQAADCCVPLSKIVASTLKSEPSVPLDRGRALLASPAGKGFYGAYVLPDDDQTYYFKVESLVVRDAHSVGSVVAPVVLILNDDFSVSRASTPSMLFYLPELSFHGQRESLNLFVRVDRNSHPREKYVVVTTSEKIIGQELNIADVSGGQVMVLPTGKSFTVTQSPTRVQNVTMRSLPTGPARLIYISSWLDRPASDRSIRF